DLGVEDCKELQLLLGPLATDCLTALLPGAPHSAADPAQDPQLSGLPLHLLHACVLGRCTPLRKLRTLTQLLDAPMRDIVALWEQRELQVGCLREAAGFDPDDVQHLLCALFEASEYRRDALARVAASSW
ncbi:centromere/kinetochore zw10-like protein, partial [Haematococcus lacustris]